METATPEMAEVRYHRNVNHRHFEDYFKTAGCGDADRDYRDTPVSLLGARQALNLAKFAGGSQDAPAELQQADDDLQAAEKAWRFNQSSTEVDVLARKATSSGAKAEEIALARRAARLRREDIQRRDEALRTAEKTVESDQRGIDQLRVDMAGTATRRG